MKKLKEVKKLRLGSIKIARLSSAADGFLSKDPGVSNAATCLRSCGPGCSVITCEGLTCTRV